MGSTKSKPITENEQPVQQPKGARKWDSFNVPMTQNVFLIWLDANIDKTSDGCQNTINNFRHIVNNINTFTDGEECMQFLQDMAHEKACMIISGSLGQEIVPRIHDLTQVDSIFILCNNEGYHRKWANHWPKIKNVFSEMEPLSKALKQAANQCEQNAISISILSSEGGEGEKSGNQLEPSFMYTQIMKEIFLTIDFDQHHIDRFIEYCRQDLSGNAKQLHYVDEIIQQNNQHTPIWWYTRDCFLQPILNRALRVMNVDLLIRFGFFIRDLHHQIDQLHREQIGDHEAHPQITLYRGQGMEKKAFEKMVASKGGLISFNSFLSTTTSHAISLQYAESASQNPQLVGVLFIMAIDPSSSSTPFASVDRVGYFGDGEDEVLFSMHTVFRIGEITLVDGDPRLAKVQLKLVSDQDNDLRELVNYMRRETFPDMEGWYRLGALLEKVGESNQATLVYKELLDRVTDESEKASIYHAITRVKNALGEYTEAVESYEKALAICEKTLPSNHPGLAASYSNIGGVYDSMGEYSQSLSFHQKALAIFEETLPSNHPSFATSYNNIALAYHNMGEYSQALSFFQKALAIEEKILPSNHPDLATSYNNIAGVYDNMGQHPEALSFYQKSLAIYEKTLPSDHPNLATSYNNIALVYDHMGEYSQALSSYQKALAIREKTLASNHPDLAASYNNIAGVYDSMGEYSQALSFHQKALAIFEGTLPSNHPYLATSYNNIAFAYDRMGEYSQALSFHQKALAIKKKILSPDHPNLATSYSNIALVYDNMGEYSQALAIHQKAHAIYQKTLSLDHPNLATSYNNIGRVYDSMGEYSEALSFHQKALAIYEKTLPPDHPYLAISYDNIGKVYHHMEDYDKALSFYERALQIGEKALPANHPKLAWYYNDIGMVYNKRVDHTKALSFHERAVKIGERSLPATHPHLKLYRDNVDKVQRKLECLSSSSK